MPIWSDSYLQQLTNDGETEIASKLTPIWQRFSLAVTAGTAEYSINDYVQKIQRVTWKGKRLYPITFSELIILDPNFASHPNAVPQYYIYNEEGVHSIRFWPTPDETIGADDTNINKLAGVNARVIISCFRTPDLTASNFGIPAFIARRTVKAYVLSMAYRIKNEGQNLVAAEYYKNKYKFLVEAYKSIHIKHFSPIIVPSSRQVGRLPKRVSFRNDQQIG